MINLKALFLYSKFYLFTFSSVALFGFLCAPKISSGQDISQLAVKARENLYDNWDFEKSARYFDQVIGEKHAPAFAYSDYGWYLLLVNRHDEGMSYIQRAASMASTDKQLIAWYAWALLWNGDLTKAKRWIQKALDIDVGYGEALQVSSRIEFELGNHDEAIKLAHEAAASDIIWRGIVPVIYAKIGKHNLAEENALKISKNTSAFDAMFLLEFYTILGLEEKALDYLERAYDLRHPFMPWLEITPDLIQLHDHPRFQKIVKKMNLPKTSK